MEKNPLRTLNKKYMYSKGSTGGGDGAFEYTIMASFHNINQLKENVKTSHAKTTDCGG